MTDWSTRQDYIRVLGDLRLEINREMDRAQIGETLVEGGPLTAAMGRVLGTRGRIIHQQQEEEHGAESSTGSPGDLDPGGPVATG
jgi:hypothetical protein